MSKPRSQAKNDAVFSREQQLRELAERATVPELLALVKSQGVEDCAELMRYVPTEQLRAVLDLDVWRNRGRKLGRGRAETFDARRFLRWLEALLAAGAVEAADTFAELGVEFCAGVMAHFLEPTPMDVYAMNRAESGLAREDKDVEHGRNRELGVFGGAYVMLRSGRSRSALGGLSTDETRDIMHNWLTALEEQHPELLQGVFFHMSRQVDDDVVRDDFAADRNLRLEGQGFIPAEKAAELMLRCRTETGILDAAAHSLEDWPPADWEAFCRDHGLIPTAQNPHAGADFPAAAAGALTTTQDHASYGHALVAACASWCASRGQAHAEAFQKNWYFLANLLANGWERQGKRLGPRRAVSLLTATVELGLIVRAQSRSEHGRPEAPRDLLDVFATGWSHLHGIGQRAARLLDARIRRRSAANHDLRECFFRFCAKRRISDVAVAHWLAQGHFLRIREALPDIEVFLTPRARHLLEHLADATPTAPKASASNQNRNGTLYFCYPGQESALLEELRTELDKTVEL